MAADISARLAQFAKDPPDLAAYFRLHAECVIGALHPVGLTYEMQVPQGFQRTFAHNYDSLGLREAPAQEHTFQRAVRRTAEQGQPIFLDANTMPANAAHGVTADDVPAPEMLPLYNQTPFQHLFVPIPLNKKPAGVLHAWFSPADAAAAHARAALLVHAAGEIELYLKARRMTDISQELARATTYARFLEDVAGDQDLDSVAWKLVNYAREAVACDRVCLLVDSRYGLSRTTGLPPTEDLDLQACSGLRRPHARSEHAEVLKAHAAELLKLAVEQPATPATPETGRASEETAANPADKEAAPNRTAAAKAGETRPRMRIIFTNRDPAKTASRPDAVNRYFEAIPMNWSTVLPLYDRENTVCGTLLFEGQQSSEKVAPLFVQMRDLAVSGGRALATALTWRRRRALRGARVVMRWRDSLFATSRRQLAIKYVLPALALIAVLALPIPYKIRGDATLRPVKVETLAALTTGRLMEVNTREGARVKKGDILCVLDSTELQLMLRQTEQDRERYETEANLALRERRETTARVNRLNAARDEAQAEKLRRDIERAVIRAPFDGVLVGPQDLLQRRGQVIRVGETVAEIVDTSQWEVKISVREQDVPTLMQELQQRRAKNAQASIPGQLVLTADPNHVYGVNLTDPESFSQRLDTGSGKYNFSAVIPIEGPVADGGPLSAAAELKTGYTGRAAFACDRRTLARILFGDFFRFLKVNFF